MFSCLEGQKICHVLSDGAIAESSLERVYCRYGAFSLQDYSTVHRGIISFVEGEPRKNMKKLLISPLELDYCKLLSPAGP